MPQLRSWASKRAGDQRVEEDRRKPKKKQNKETKKTNQKKQSFCLKCWVNSLSSLTLWLVTSFVPCVCLSRSKETSIPMSVFLVFKSTSPPTLPLTDNLPQVTPHRAATAPAGRLSALPMRRGFFQQTLVVRRFVRRWTKKNNNCLSPGSQEEKHNFLIA